MIATAWNNGQHHVSGAGYGLKLSPEDRDAYFSKHWKSILLELRYEDRGASVEVKVAKTSFWGERCRELINKEIGRWLIAHQLAPWPKRKPPKIEIEHLGGRHFRVLGVATG